MPAASLLERSMDGPAIFFEGLTQDIMDAITGRHMICSVTEGLMERYINFHRHHFPAQPAISRNSGD